MVNFIEVDMELQDLNEIHICEKCKSKEIRLDTILFYCEPKRSVFIKCKKCGWKSEEVILKDTDFYETNDFFKRFDERNAIEAGIITIKYHRIHKDNHLCDILHFGEV